MNGTGLLRIAFDAMEYQADGSFKKISYAYEGSEEIGWSIFRENNVYLQLPAGYRLLKTLACGICSTDIARTQLPFPLPQITGHEVVALDGNQRVVVEINASHYARGSETDCYFCNNGLANHCPERLTLGIDRLPGGFAPYVLAPKNSIIPLPDNISLEMAVITEPLAAAIRAIELTPLNECQSVAVVGPRRLGSLLLVALRHYRNLQNLCFSITAIVRSSTHSELCAGAGADEVLLLEDINNRKFDAVFDTSGSNTGFEVALNIAQKIVHLKSTSGQVYEGIEVLSQMVVDEISLNGIDKKELVKLTKNSENILADERLVFEFLQLGKSKTISFYSEYNVPKSSALSGRYDTLIVTNLLDLNRLIEPMAKHSYLKPMGKIYLCPLDEDDKKNKLGEALIDRKVNLLTSRCGNFRKALELLQLEKPMMAKFIRQFITHEFDIIDISDALAIARHSSSSVKVVIKF